MPIIKIKLKDPSETVLLQSILGGYSHLAWVRSEESDRSVVSIFTTDDLVDEAAQVLQSLMNAVEFDFVNQRFLIEKNLSGR